MNRYRGIILLLGEGNSRTWRWVLVFAVSLIGLSILFSWAASGFTSLLGWAEFLLVLLLGVGILAGGWFLIKAEAPPRWLGMLLLGAAFLRLLLGAVWFAALPSSGYGSPAERSGYIMADAYNRDKVAWQLGHSGKSLSKIFTSTSYRKVDQYGGLLMFSSMFYRVFGGDTHRPLIMIPIVASISSLAVLFTWAFARRTWGDTAGSIAAWGMALYPEAVLLGSSQMREAFLIPLVMAAVYGIICFSQHRTWQYLAWVMIPLALSIPFSPPASAQLVASLALLALATGDRHLLRQFRFWVLLAIVALVVMTGMWFAWRRYAPVEVNNPLALIYWWLKTSAVMQARLSRLDSGWLQKVFRILPESTHYLFTVVYGVIRPLLPAALVDTTSALIWRLVATWRAVGWTILLPLLGYAPVLALRKAPSGKELEQSIARAACLVVWGGMLLASFRAGADLWDNPRYRAMFAGLQIALAAWVWVRYRQDGDRWLKPILVSLGIILLWLIPWYLFRYGLISWPVGDLFLTIGLGLASAVGYMIWFYRSTLINGKKD